MDIQPIKTEKDYEEALQEIATLMSQQPAEGTEDYNRLDILATLVEAYEQKHVEWDTDKTDPVEVIKFHMNRLNLTQTKLAEKANLNQSHLSAVLNRRRKLSLSQMKKLSCFFDIPVDRLVNKDDVRIGV